jgi:hypothetical protein
MTLNYIGYVNKIIILICLCCNIFKAEASLKKSAKILFTGMILGVINSSVYVIVLSKIYTLHLTPNLTGTRTYIVRVPGGSVLGFVFYATKRCFTFFFLTVLL